MRTRSKVLVSVGAGLVVWLAVHPQRCTAVGGVHVWDRCTSFLGTPTPSFEDIPQINTGWIELIPIFISIAVGVLVWWLLGRAISKGK